MAFSTVMIFRMHAVSAIFFVLAGGNQSLVEASRAVSDSGS